MFKSVAAKMTNPIPAIMYYLRHDMYIHSSPGKMMGISHCAQWCWSISTRKINWCCPITLQFVVIVQAAFKINWLNAIVENVCDKCSNVQILSLLYTMNIDWTVIYIICQPSRGQHLDCFCKKAYFLWIKYSKCKWYCTDLHRSSINAPYF